MRVFVSYSFVDKELYLLTLLVSKLREKGNVVQLSDNDYLSEKNIYHSDMFVGIITDNSDSINNVFNEYLFAEQHNKQRILLIEEGVQVNRKDIQFIRFNRNNPQLAIQQLFKENETQNNRGGSVVEDIVKAGVVIAGIAALISLLGGNGNNNGGRR